MRIAVDQLAVREQSIRVLQCRQHVRVDLEDVFSGEHGNVRVILAVAVHGFRDRQFELQAEEIVVLAVAGRDVS